FLVDGRVYKLKRAIELAFLDFRTLSARRAACRAEIAINRRTAPDLYLGVRALSADGRLVDSRSDGDGDGAAVDCLVEMRRFDGDDLFDKMAEEGRLTDDLLEKTATSIAGFHASARPRPDMWRPGRMRALIDQIDASFPADPPSEVGRETIAGVIDRIRQLADEHAPLIERRRAGGFVREVHGDLHLRNIVLWRGAPTLFDAIEFDEEIRCGDCLYDIAFLLMDLGFRGLAGAANRTHNVYVRESGDIDGLALMPLFIGLRAAIRSHVEISTAAHLAMPGEGFASASAYLNLAQRVMANPAPSVIAIGGLSGTGKSTVARAIAPDIGPLPGALILRSDEIRKELAGVASTERLSPDFYTADWSAKVYAELIDRSRRGVEAGQNVIADAVFGDPGHRAAIARVAKDCGVGFSGIWLEAPRDVAVRRVSFRRDDASDADARVAASQSAAPPKDTAWQTVASGGALATTADLVRRGL
ncbi:MAG: AAA family ATPase, partial [Pseudomonadota bacterium]